MTLSLALMTHNLSDTNFLITKLHASGTISPGEFLIMHRLVERWGCGRGWENKQSSLHLLHLHCTPLTDKSEWRLGRSVDIQSRREEKLLLRKICLNKRNTAKKVKNNYTLPAIFLLISSMLSSSPIFETKDKQLSQENTQTWPLRLNVKTKLIC